MLKAEISKNIAINKLNADDEVNTDLATDKLDLGGQNLKDLAFLPKMIPEYTNLETIDLSNSDMRIENNVKQLCAMIDGNNTLQHLILQKCHINGNTLNLIADALCRDSNSNLKTVDIRENPIQDPQYKVLLGLMQANERLDSIEYTLNDQDNLHAVEQFKGLLKEGNDLKEATTRMKEMHDEHHHHATPLWQKICFPIWCWKSLIHDKHEAFRFKYDSKAINRIEDEMMPGVKSQLYWWTVVYYTIIFVMPYFFIAN